MKQNLLIFDVDYILDGERGIVRLFCKDEKGDTIIVLDSEFKSYFYVEPKEGKMKDYKKKLLGHDFKEGKIVSVEEAEKEFIGEKKKLLKITVENPRDVYNIREEVKEWPEDEEEYEYAISFYQQYMIDKEIKPISWVEVDGEEFTEKRYQAKKVINTKNITPLALEKEVKMKTLAFDIEIAEEKGEEKIIMISFADNYGFKKVITTWKQDTCKLVEILPDEKTLLERFVEIITKQDPDFLVSYNGDNFDFPKIKDRSEKLRVSLRLGRDNSEVRLVRRGRISSTKIRGRVHIDLFDYIDHALAPTMKTEVLTLDAVAEELLGLRKRDIKWKDIQESWKTQKGLEHLADYCQWDSELTLKLSEQLLPQIFAISQLTGLIPFDAGRYTYSQLDEAYLMRNAFKQNVLIPNSPKQDEIAQRRMKPKYAGGFVIEPKKGIHADILVFDFRSLYPTVIVTHNISPDTIDCGHDECKRRNKTPDTEHYYCTTEKGFIPRNLEEIIKDRTEVKKKMKDLKKDSLEFKRLDNLQYALKIIANSTYGYMGYFGARWYCYPCAASAASFGRFYIHRSIDMMKEENFEVMYGDTDSVFVAIPKVKKTELVNKAEKFLKKINEQLPGMIELEFRGIYEGGIFVTTKGKKKGAKKRYALIDAEGNLEIRGFETVRRNWCDLAKNIQHEILRILLQDRDPDKATKLVRDTIKKIQDGKAILEELMIYTQLVKPISTYESIGPHVKVAKKMRDRGKPIGEGMILNYIITKKPGSISDKAEPTEDVKEGDYDSDYYINHQVLPAAMRVLSALGLTEQQVLSGRIQTSLGKWFEK
jgi:DNA polymerase elongation subunit (family B)